MPLTDSAIRNAKPGEKAVKLFDIGAFLGTAGFLACVIEQQLAHAVPDPKSGTITDARCAPVDPNNPGKR